MSLSNIGYIYRVKGDNEKALNYFQQSLDIREKTGDQHGITRSLYNIGSIKFMEGKMTEAFESIANRVIDLDNSEFLDFHSRRLVEMAGNIIMGYLLVINGQRDEKFYKTAKLFINLARSENQERFDYINNFEIEDLELYKLSQFEVLQEQE